MKNLTLIALTFMFFTQVSHANIISQEYQFTTNSNDTSYFDFTVTTAGFFNLDAFGFSTLGDGYDYDTMLRLFHTALDIANYMGGDDDSGTGTDAHINIALDTGDYIMAVGDFSFSANDAVIGVGGFVETPGGLIRAQVAAVAEGFAIRTNAAVTEPSALALMGLGLLGFVATRRRKRQE